MKNKEQWRPTKFELGPEGWRASRDPKQVGVGSRFIGDILAKEYEAMINQHAKGVILDLGCGKVPLYALYRSYTTEVICIDWENTLHPSQHLDIECNLNVGIQCPSNSVDTILVTDVLEHVVDPGLLWREMARVLKPEGIVLLGVPFLYWIHESPHDYFRFTEFALRRFVDQVDLQLITLEPYGGWLEVVCDLLAKRIARHSKLSALHLYFCQMITSSQFGRKIPHLTAEEFPLGYILVAQK